VPVSLCTFIAALPARYAELWRAAVQGGLLLRGQPTVALLLSPHFYPVAVLALEIVVMLTCAAAAVVVFWRRSDDRMAVVASLSLVTYGALFTPELDALAAAHPFWQAPVLLVQATGLESTLLLFYLSPTGHFVPRWTRPLAVIWTMWATMSALAPSAPFNLLHGRPHVASPTTFPLLWFAACLGWYGTGVAAQIYRYRHMSTPLQRQQTKWVLAGQSSVIAVYGALVLPRITLAALSQPGLGDLLYSRVGVPFFEAILLLAPLTITRSMLRYRLWEVDMAVNRALVYGALTVTLGLSYADLVMALEWIFHTAIGHGSPLAIVVTTLAIAALFHPLRQRVQGIVDRRFYRRKYDAVRLVERFGQQVRDEVDLNILADDLLAVVQETMQPASVSLWLIPSPAADSGRGAAERTASHSAGAGQRGELR
jgi:hypothetical protein